MTDIKRKGIILVLGDSIMTADKLFTSRRCSYDIVSINSQSEPKIKIIKAKKTKKNKKQKQKNPNS